jgi:hypothetical protein
LLSGLESDDENSLVNVIEDVWQSGIGADDEFVVISEEVYRAEILRKAFSALHSIDVGSVDRGEPFDYEAPVVDEGPPPGCQAQ